MSHSLSDRGRLRSDLRGIGSADVLLCEIKAAAVDVATTTALDEGLDVIYMDNVPHGVGPSGGATLDDVLEWAVAEADARFEQVNRTKGGQ
jgi:cyclic 2,3-diphosphoglycerate synthetase